ncbi:MAG: efflux RND transporter permease subunit [Myxococcales bacterium]|nr:efflux RND transporter permease subunit [Myxococcales bacterium]
MLKHLIAWSLRHPWVVVFGSVALVLASLGALRTMPVDVFPELNAPTVVVLTEAGGLGSVEVEQRVTGRLETAISGLPGIRRIRSASALSLSIVWAEFDWGFDVYRARQLVSEKLAGVREQLPENTHVEIGPVSSITGEIMLISLSSPTGAKTPGELRALGEFDLRNALLAVPGISQVVAIGGALPEYQVIARQDALLAAGLTFSELTDAARAASSVRSAGYLPDVKGEELAVAQDAQARLGTLNAARLDGAGETHGAGRRLGEVADVQLGGAPPRGTASDRGTPAVVLSIQKAPGTNTLALTALIDAALDGFEKTLPEGVSLNRHGFRQANFIQRSVDNLGVVLRDAIIAVAIVLILFLLDVRMTVITLTALPISMAVALLVLWALGLTINVMTLGGLAVAIGELVDDAIIDVENVHRRLRENRSRPVDERRPTLRVIYDASNEVRGSVVFATVIIAIVFLPMLFFEGLEGRFFRPLGIAYIASILASLLVALTLTPALCRLLLGKAHGSEQKPDRDSALVRLLHRLYRPTLALVLRFRRTVLVLTTAVAAATLWLGSTFGSSFLPEFNEGTFTVFLMAPVGTSLTESDRLAGSVEKQLSRIDGIASVIRRTGRAERDEHAEPVFNSEVEITMTPGTDKLAIRREIDRVLGEVPGISTMIGQPIEHRLSHILSGTPAAIALSVYGQDLDGLRRVAQELEVALKAIPGLRDIAANREIRIPGLRIEYRDDDLVRLGLTREAAAEQVGALTDGVRVTTLQDGPRTIDVAVRLHSDERRDHSDLRRLVLIGAEGQLVRLEEVANVLPERTPNIVAREGGRRKAVISCNVADGYDLGSMIGRVQAAADPIVQKAGFTVSYGGQFEAQQSAQETLVLYGGLVLLVILFLLNAALKSVRSSLLVLVNLPLALIGGIIAIFVTSGAPMDNLSALFGIGQHRYVPPIVSVASLVGFVTLFGIAVRSGILLVNHVAWLREEEGLPVREAVLRGSLERLVPILMTALTAVLGLVPLALAAGQPGSELLAPLATVVLGGLVSATFLNLIVVPAAWSLVFEKDAGPKARKDDLSLS